MAPIEDNIWAIMNIPRQWFDNITSNIKNMGLKAYPNDSCMYMGSLTPGGTPIYTGLYTCMTLSTLVNLVQWKNSSEHPFRLHSKLTGRATHTGLLAPTLNDPLKTKSISMSICVSQNFTNTHQNTLAWEMVTWIPSLHTTTVSLLTTFPSQIYLHQIK